MCLKKRWDQIDPPAFLGLNPFTNISGYLNLWDFSGSFLDNLE